jgi:predicted  nucleic acid-binding Zn-ribbon protein
MMKRVLFSGILLIVTLLAVSCKDNSWKEKEKKLQDSFDSIQQKQNSTIENLFKNLNEIDSTLQEVNQMYITAKDNADNYAVNNELIESIKQKIEIVKQRLANQETKVVVMQSETPQSDYSQLKQMISNLQVRIFDKQQEIDRLKNELASKDKQIATLQDAYSTYQNNIKELNAESKKRDAKISEMEDAQNVAYFIIGTRYELLRKGVIDQKGGFIGIGKWPVVSSNSDLAIMKKIDIRNTRQIPLSGQKATIITPHNTASYSLDGSKEYPKGININDPALFWKTSHCLVVVLN